MTKDSLAVSATGSGTEVSGSILSRALQCYCSIEPCGRFAGLVVEVIVEVVAAVTLIEVVVDLVLVVLVVGLVVVVVVVLSS
ncbi:hypothetical protein ElyMa_000136700 [Elysia marginata]|uniref:Uncharacterized protein n=1 Tax=Elysia marginata TaxID=1093978 RepID=A0AAV4EQC0_9GAST|nr:hypothetical protein ElyMa_000136700 [Elysia marginata]